MLKRLVSIKPSVSNKYYEKNTSKYEYFCCVWQGEAGNVDVSFSFDSLENAKSFFKMMMDHHAFFRMMREQQSPSCQKPNLFNSNDGEGDYKYNGATAGQEWSTLNTIERPVWAQTQGCLGKHARYGSKKHLDLISLAAMRPLSSIVT